MNTPAGACAYIAAWDVHRAKLFDRCERKTGIAPFDRLVAQVMREEPYRSARRGVHTHKATTSELKELWAKVANERLENTGDEGRAIREANAVVGRQSERS
jgi:hypothetical protein